ncbi:ABC transporter permease [Balneola sp. MJW-20]|uniref:ABC transporter permease n=1 Tax=Gracilimonas aurantiaca TaxID=3234185 RepID=UPI003465E60A
MIWTILKLGWKNVWRNPTRSSVVIIAVVLGTWAGIFSAGFFNGFMQDYLDNQIELTTGHIQIMHPEFDDQFDPKFTIPGADKILNELRSDGRVTELIGMSQVTGLAQSTRNSFGVTINGLSATDSLGFISRYLTEGALPDDGMRNPILIGTELAKRLSLGLRSRMVLSFQDISGEITGGAFRVAGIFDSFNDRYDENTVFVLRKDLNRLLGEEDVFHLIRIQTSNLSLSDRMSTDLANTYDQVELKSWKDLSPDLRYLFDMTDLTLYIVMMIIIIGLVFSIINTMLMAVLERTRELGMLRAIGMNKTRTFNMVMWETFFLTMVGSPIGLLLSWLTINYFAGAGIDLSAFAQGLNQYGMATLVYPSLSAPYYFNLMLMIAGAAILSALYPAWRTLQLRPVEAIRKFN